MYVRLVCRPSVRAHAHGCLHTRATFSEAPERWQEQSRVPERQRNSFRPPGVTWVAGGSPFPTSNTKVAGERLTAHLARQIAKQAGKCSGVQKATLCFVNQMDSKIG